VLHGTHGSYQKQRTDPQEAQLLAGLAPTAPGYGHEPPGHAGLLTLATADGPPQTTPDAAAPGNYMGLFEAVYATIRHQAPYPIMAGQLLVQSELLELPAAD
jgi:scyllo-inositol 2-dehydrogenase (NADP+)